MTMYVMTDVQFQAVYNVLSFSLASMMATTLLLWFRSFAVRDNLRSAVLISRMVTFIVAYHYMHIFNSWMEGYRYTLGATDPALTGMPFNDAYRYINWLLTVPLLLIETLLVMRLSLEEHEGKSKALGVSSVLMIVSGYYGVLVITGDLTPRWMCWFISMVFFVSIVFELLVGLSVATNLDHDAVVKGKLKTAQVVTCLSRSTYPVVFFLSMLSMSGATSVVSVQIGYCVSDIISKCGVGLLIYQISLAKTQKESLFQRIEDRMDGVA